MFTTFIPTDIYGNVVVTDLWNRIVQIIITVISFVVILIIGWAIAVIAGKIVKGVLVFLNVDRLWTRFGGEKMEKSGMKINLARVGEEFVKWVIILLALIAATEYAGLYQVAQFLNKILNYVPNIIVAIIILAIGILIASFTRNVVKGSFQAAGLAYSELVADLARAVVVIFVVLTALEQLGVKLEFISIFFTGIVAMMAIAGGLAFGLGGQGVAREILEKVKSEMKER